MQFLLSCRRKRRDLDHNCEASRFIYDWCRRAKNCHPLLILAASWWKRNIISKMTIGAKVQYGEMPDVQAFSKHGKVINTSRFVTSSWRPHWATPTTSTRFSWRVHMQWRCQEVSQRNLGSSDQLGSDEVVKILRCQSMVGKTIQNVMMCWSLENPSRHDLKFRKPTALCMCTIQ